MQNELPEESITGITRLYRKYKYENIYEHATYE